jgi:hypothetical protein
MRTLRALALLVAVVLAGFLLPAPAQAGGWAVTVLDPVPERLEPGTPYTVGMWVLQHGSHPFEGDLGAVSLTLTGDQGEVTYPAVPLIEPAHYAAAIVAPRPGTYKVVAAQGFFAPYHVGTLTVPGGFVAGAMPAPLPFADGEKFWPGLVRPPIMPVDPNRDPFASDVAPAVKAPPAQDPVAAQAPAAPPRSRTPLVVSAAVVVAGLALLLTYRQRQTGGQRSGPSPSSSSMTWIAASSADAPPPSMPASQATESASTSSPNPSSSSTSRPARGSVS